MNGNLLIIVVHARQQSLVKKTQDIVLVKKTDIKKKIR